MWMLQVLGHWAPLDDPPLTLAWGRGYCDERDITGHYDGGIFMASNVAHSTRVWNASIKELQDIAGPLGSLEHLRGDLGRGAVLQAGDLIWMTDSTPHESLRLPQGTARQYFRLVTGDISVWYSAHSTANPLGTVPPAAVKVVHENKFTGGAAAANSKGVMAKAKKSVTSLVSRFERRGGK